MCVACRARMWDAGSRMQPLSPVPPDPSTAPVSLAAAAVYRGFQAFLAVHGTWDILRPVTPGTPAYGDREHCDTKGLVMHLVTTCSPEGERHRFREQRTETSKIPVPGAPARASMLSDTGRGRAPRGSGCMHPAAGGAPVRGAARLSEYPRAARGAAHRLAAGQSPRLAEPWPQSVEALVGFQGRGFADGVQPDFCHFLLLEALIFQ